MRDNKHTSQYLRYHMVTRGVRKQGGGEEHLSAGEDPAGGTARPFPWLAPTQRIVGKIPRAIEQRSTSPQLPLSPLLLPPLLF